jgi:predicted  nucleic acid-binding Zn ribbon protein
MDHIENDRLTACPSCGAPMRFLRTVPPISDLPEMQTFECRPCRLAVTAEQLLQFPELLSSVSA